MKKRTEVWALLGIPNAEVVQASLEALIQIGLRSLGADEGSLLVYRKQENVLEFVQTIGRTRTPPNLVGKTIPLGQGITGMAALTKDIQTATRATSQSAFYTVEDDGSPNTVLAAPMLVDDDLIGVITAVSFDTDKVFTSEDCQMFGLLAFVGGVVVEQQQKLSGVSEQGDVKPLSNQKAQELRIAELAFALAGQHPERVAKTIALLEMVKDL